jgi:hypothetical protein
MSDRSISLLWWINQSCAFRRLRQLCLADSRHDGFQRSRLPVPGPNNCFERGGFEAQAREALQICHSLRSEPRCGRSIQNHRHWLWSVCHVQLHAELVALQGHTKRARVQEKRKRRQCRQLSLQHATSFDKSNGTEIVIAQVE